ncbi:HNH endonuclease [Hymenobacter endophyticus]|uniref:HNH endonuclease n=1 Tax=Hymenobacter endophyticus TaxID=3076335 RepID=A0ABU3TM98_9BACT|nr:HNH endonuclease [Hymenobacter endophyticus]MDU0372484.1 HNH endonuclease [Hymenobacter endophyticus]
MAKFIYDHPRQKAKRQVAIELHQTYGINQGTANDFIRVFHHLLEGSVFKRALSEYAMRHFIAGVQRDYGILSLQKALGALNKHIFYREEGNAITGRRPVSQAAMKRIYNDFNNNLPTHISTAQSDEQEEHDAIKALAQITDIKLAILAYATSTAEKITITHTSYKRNNVVVALIKKYREYKCQICGHQILKADGSYYIEAAHIEPHHIRGRATLDNILILCPNHHKEFDLGKTQIQREDGNGFIRITINDQAYSVALH